MTLIVNLFGAPSTGKSTQAAGLFYRLKMRQVNCELITEKAKDLTWEKNFNALGNQLYVSAHQIYRQETLENQVDCVVTDSPLLLGIFYDKHPSEARKKMLKNFLLQVFSEKENLNVYVKRKGKYQDNGRNQNEEEANRIDEAIRELFYIHNLPILTVDGTKAGLDELFNITCNTLRTNGVNIS